MKKTFSVKTKCGFLRKFPTSKRRREYMVARFISRIFHSHSAVRVAKKRKILPPNHTKHFLAMQCFFLSEHLRKENTTINM